MLENLDRETAHFLLQTNSCEEAGPLIQRVHERAEARPDLTDRAWEVAVARALAVRFQARRGDVGQAVSEMEVQNPILATSVSLGTCECVNYIESCGL